MPKYRKHTRRIQNETIVKPFVAEYIKNGGNASQAVLKVKPVTLKSAGTIGSQLLKREDVQREIIAALSDTGIDFKYVLGTRKQFIEKGVEQLNGKRTEGSFVSPSDVGKHLTGIESILFKLGELDASTNLNGSSHLHLHLENKNVSEVVQERNKSKEFFDSILEGEVLDSEAS